MKKKRNRGKAHWFIEPHDHQTNESLAEEFAGEEIQELEYNGQTIKVWECTWAQVQMAASSSILRFAVYRKRGNGKLERMDWVLKSKSVCRK